MKNLYLYIFILCCIILGVSFFNTYINYKESFNSSKQTFVLLGDSIFKNNNYVSDGNSVDYLLSQKTQNKTICLATDDSTIVDVYNQISNVPDGLNNSTTTIFLSIGGNNIISHYVNNEYDSENADILGTIFAAYKKLVKIIQSKLPNANIVLLDIYYPENLTYKQYHPIINKWNNMIYTYSKLSKNNIYGVLKVSNILTQPDDFTLGIEPSATGSKKLVDAMMSNY